MNEVMRATLKGLANSSEDYDFFVVARRGNQVVRISGEIGDLAFGLERTDFIERFMRPAAVAILEKFKPKRDVAY